MTRSPRGCMTVVCSECRDFHLLPPPPRDEYLAMSILHMTNAVSFLNNDCKLVRIPFIKHPPPICSCKRHVP